MNFKWLPYIAVFLIATSPVAAETLCNNKTVDSKIDEVIATADTLPNFRNIAGSLRFESNRLLGDAQNSLVKGTTPPANTCPKDCTMEDKPQIIFSCIPQKYLKDSSDKDYCNTMQQKTTIAPFTYNNRLFSSITQLADWFSDFSQGKGDDGNDLYKRCDKSCSPQYTNQIQGENSKLTLNASVICGPARDKSDNKYVLTTSFRWRCLPGK